MRDRHVRAVALPVADDGHFQFGAGGQGRLAGFRRQHHRAVCGGNPQRGAEAGARADHQGRAACSGLRSAQVQHAAGTRCRPTSASTWRADSGHGRLAVITVPSSRA
ncbi:hypothetical protein G6F53_013555 [Rhizopus delemar]|nr:hypothetical protein G6F53_013555 [Rhizopus delemar]